MKMATLDRELNFAFFGIRNIYGFRKKVGETFRLKHLVITKCVNFACLYLRNGCSDFYENTLENCAMVDLDNTTSFLDIVVFL